MRHSARISSPCFLIVLMLQLHRRWVHLTVSYLQSHQQPTFRVSILVHNAATSWPVRRRSCSLRRRSSSLLHSLHAGAFLLLDPRSPRPPALQQDLNFQVVLADDHGHSSFSAMQPRYGTRLSSRTSSIRRPNLVTWRCTQYPRLILHQDLNHRSSSQFLTGDGPAVSSGRYFRSLRELTFSSTIFGAPASPLKASLPEVIMFF